MPRNARCALTLSSCALAAGDSPNENVVAGGKDALKGEVATGDSLESGGSGGDAPKGEVGTGDGDVPNESVVGENAPKGEVAAGDTPNEDVPAGGEDGPN